MLDVKTLESQHLSLLAAFYGYTKFVYGSNLPHAPAWKQKRAKRWFCKQYATSIDKMPEVVRQYFAPDTDVVECIAFLEECYAENSLRAVNQFERQKETLAPLGEAVAQAVQALNEIDPEEGDMVYIERFQGKTLLYVDKFSAFSRYLVLENAVLSPELEEYGFPLEISDVRKEDAWYVFYVVNGDFEQREALRFTHAQVQVQSYDCTKNETLNDRFWSYLYSLAYSLVRKNEIAGEACNEREKALLPLLQEIVKLGSLEDYPLLTALAEETGCKSAEFDARMEKTKRKDFYYWQCFLNGAEYEPLLRTIYEKIRLSQEGYPTVVEQRCDSERIAQKRAAITEFLHQKGFVGEYPDFYKTADIPGYHIVPSQGGKVLYCRVKNAQMFIRCMENWAGAGEMRVNFVCGRALTGKRPPVRDILSCAMEDKGYRWCRIVWDNTFCPDSETPFSRDCTMEAAGVAVKKVQLQKLTKYEERKYGVYSALRDPSQKIILGIFAFMLPVCLLLVAAIMAISGDWDGLREMSTTFPLWEVLLGYGIVYGIPFGIFAILRGRR